MEHSVFKEKILLYFYEELSQQERIEFEKHKVNCEGCAKIYEEELAFFRELEKDKSTIVNDRILSSARYQLSRALREEQKAEKESAVDRLFSFLFTPYRFAVSSAVVLTIGLLIGYALFSSESTKPIIKDGNGNFINASDGFVFNDQVLRISNIQFIDADASDGEIEFEFEAVKPVRMKGSVNDPQIQAILAYSMLNNQNPGSRLSSINAIETKPQVRIDSDTKNSLLTVMLTDENPGVRLEALRVLKKLPYDETIKQSFLTVLTSDTTSGLRIEAINAISDLIEGGLTFSEDELTLFKEKFNNDDNNYIKFKSRTILQEYN
ncbi:MAG TPA: HEAT repeat domain-containing protein [Ignavibacteriaceae bacterium]|nr:HEAT repeat domain-containing protein [Ignavibacteriaceae bacterium]